MLKKIILIFILFKINGCQWSEECLALNCKICCGKDSNNKYICLQEPLRCRLKPNSDFQILVTTLIIIGSFVIGVPFFLFIINVWIIRRFCFKMSICEFIVNFIFLCICFKKKSSKKLAENKDKILINKKKKIIKD